MSVQPAFGGKSLDGRKPALELPICGIERETRMDTGLPAEIDAGEQEIAELVLQLGVHFIVYRGAVRVRPHGAALQVNLHLAQLLFDLCGGTLDVGPVEAHACRAVLQPMGPMEGRQRFRKPFADAGAPARLHPLPRLLRSIFIQVGMPCLHLADQPLSYRGGVKGTTFLRDYTVEQDLEEDVAKLFPHSFIRARSDRLVEFVCFLDEIRAERVVCLRRIPVATQAEITHECERIVERGAVVHRVVGEGGKVARMAAHGAPRVALTT